jgi:hypothetical protein
MINYFLSTTNMLLSRFICLTNGSWWSQGWSW